jgi:SET domain-containing protein
MSQLVDFETFANAYTQFGRRTIKSAARKYLKAMSMFGVKKKVNKSRLLRHLRHDVYARVGVSKVAGVGVIAVRDIPKGVNPFKTLSKKDDPVIELMDKDLEHVNPKVKKIVDDFFGNMSVGEKGVKLKRYDVLSTGPNDINLSFYMNHSDRPNIEIVDKGEEYLSFVAKRKIHKGEELFIDYRNYEDY